jgi:hypothetical protein
MSIAPAALQAVGVVAGSQYVKAQGEEMDGQMKEETAERCEALAKAPPGVEELRKNRDGSIDSRQWHVLQRDGAGVWALSQAPTRENAGWNPRPGLANLGFSPPLADQLQADKPRFIAYAPAEIGGPSDAEIFDNLTLAFGAGQGKFNWRGRDYEYVLVARLPCFKTPK